MLSLARLDHRAVSRTRAVHQALRHPVAAEPVRPVRTARVLARDEQALDACAAVTVNDHSAHVVVRRRADLHRRAREVTTYLTRAGNHAREGALHLLDAEMGDVEIHSALLRAPAGHNLHVAGAGDHVARRALEPLGIVPLHEALAEPVVQVRSRAAQPLFEDRTGETRLTRKQACRVKLQHLHVAHLKPGPVAHRHAVTCLLAGGGRYLVHSGAAPGGDHHHARAKDRQVARANVQ